MSIKTRPSYRITSELIPTMSMYVQKAAYQSTTATYIAKRKKYDSVLIVYTLSGRGYLIYDEKEYVLQKGSGFIIDCNRPQVYFCDKTEGSWNFIWLHINGTNSKEQANFICSTNGPVFEKLENSLLKENLRKVIDLMPTRGVYYDILISNYLNEIMGELMLNAVSPGINQPKMPDLISSTISYLEKNFVKQINLDHLSKELLTEKFNLIRKFKANMGITPYEYLTRYRLNQAKSLLQTTDLPIYTVSEQVGFEDPSHFTKIFKKYENISPKTYRNSWKDS